MNLQVFLRRCWGDFVFLILGLFFLIDGSKIGAICCWFFSFLIFLAIIDNTKHSPSHKKEIEVKTFHSDSGLESFINNNKDKIEIIEITSTDGDWTTSRKHTIVYKNIKDET